MTEGFFDPVIEEMFPHWLVGFLSSAESTAWVRTKRMTAKE